MAKAKITAADFATLYDGFTAPVSRFDCGRNTNLPGHGKPKDNGSSFRVKVSAFKR